MIKVLDNHTINQIAAGEVVERPSSVVKELVENSIDAKASVITVEIKNGGIDLIRITDNGNGIKKDEMELAFLRHATSKIEIAKDLESVLSLGFRGEALASIASVSQIELVSKPPGELTGKKLTLEGGEIQSRRELAAPDGTTFIVRNLFFNVPARKAFLKTPQAEGTKITDYLCKLALANPHISFNYFLNNKNIFQTNGNSDLKQVIFQLHGKDIASQTIPVEKKSGIYELAGRIGKPSISKGNRSYENFFINGRFIISALLQRAVEEAYKTLTMVGKFPFVVLHLKMPPQEVDVNVHPAKLEVRFRNPDALFDFVREAVLSTLRNTNIMPSMGELKNIKPKPKAHEQLRVSSFFTPYQQVQELQFEDLVTDTAVSSKIFDVVPSASLEGSIDTSGIDGASLDGTQNTELNKSTIVNDKHNPTGKDLEISSELITYDEPKSFVESLFKVAEQPYDVPYVATNKSIEKVKELDTKLYIPKRGVDYEIIGQIFETYWLIQHYEKVLIMDQHAAHERVMYEKLLREFMNSTVHSQQLLCAHTVHLDPIAMANVKENLETLSKLGFNIELFGESDIILREVPFMFNKPMPVDKFRDFIENFNRRSNVNVYLTEEERIISMSCKAAIKGHTKITHAECQTLIEALLGLDNPYSCPHGRPTLVSLKLGDIEKLFKRA